MADERVAASIGAPHTQDTVAYLLALIPAQALQGKRARIHKAFYEIVKRFPHLLPGLAFSRNSSDPYSKPLERILFRLANAGLLSNLNPTFKEMTMKEEAKDLIKGEFAQDMVDREQELLEAAQLLEQYLEPSRQESHARP